MLADLVRTRERVTDVEVVERVASSTISQQAYANYFEQFLFGGNRYIVGHHEMLSTEAAAGNTVVGSCMNVRALILSEAEFGWADRFGSLRDLDHTAALDVLDEPWTGANTGDLIGRMDSDASYYGSSYWVPTPFGLQWVHPNNVIVERADVIDVVTGRVWAKRLLGYTILDEHRQPAGHYFPGEIVHYRPIPDPSDPYKGQSWVMQAIADVTADTELSKYKTTFMKNAATPNLAVVFSPEVEDLDLEEFADNFEARHKGSDNAFKTLYLSGGADVKAVGADFQKLEMKAVQAGGETRIVMASGLAAAVIGNSEGLAGSALNAGNYGAARRRTADGLFRPLWRSTCRALQVVVKPPSGKRLWYDDTRIPFLQEDALDDAKITQIHAATIRSLVDGGWEPEDAKQAAITGDMAGMSHTGLVSVQLLPAGTTADQAAARTVMVPVHDAIELVRSGQARFPELPELGA